MADALVEKLQAFIDLVPSDVARLKALAFDTLSLPRGHDLITEGERPEHVFLLLDGWAFRYKVLEDGRRQITAFLIPGDLCDIHIFILKEMDHSIGLLTDATVARIPKAAMLQVLQERPALAQALFWATLVDEAILRDWLVNVGRRDAYRRIAHLFCELWMRMHQVGLTDGGAFALPLTQEQLADTMGLTPVHVNRVLQRLRGDGLIALRDGQLEILDPAGLAVAGQFEANYLHLDRREPRLG